MSVSRSKYLSLILRHQPETIGLTLDEAGWAEIDELVTKSDFTRDELREIVAACPKQRFATDGDRIRASQGHSLQVELGYESAEPPASLFHGTHPSAVPAILSEGLKKMKRHHVHLSPDETTAAKVGQRRGKPVILRIDARRMAADGFSFFVSANGVWLTDSVPADYIALETSATGRLRQDQ